MTSRNDKFMETLDGVTWLDANGNEISWEEMLKQKKALKKTKDLASQSREPIENREPLGEQKT